MDREMRQILWTVVVLVSVLVLIIAGGLGWKWYRAGVQREVYQRQGCEMSQWEVFIGAKPIDRNVVIPR